jgi:hypothetical protein
MNFKEICFVYRIDLSPHPFPSKGRGLIPERACAPLELARQRGIRRILLDRGEKEGEVTLTR